MRRLIFGFLAMAAFPVAAAPEGDAERLQGAWVIQSLEIAGEKAPEDQVTTGRLVVETNRYTPRFNDRAYSETFKLDPSQTPAAIDFTYTDGPRKGETVKGIYKLEGDRYIVCRPLLAESERPKEFASPADSGLILAVWRRDGPAEEARRKAVEVERKEFDATWAGVSCLRDGVPLSENEATHARLVVTSDRYTMERESKVSRGTTRIDPTTDPKAIDVSIIDGDNKGQTWLGIYELKGDTYRACFATSGKVRPKTFASEVGSGYVYWVFQKVKE